MEPMEPKKPWHEPLEVFEQVMILSAWFREQVSLFITADVPSLDGLLGINCQGTFWHRDEPVRPTFP
jgi:hypothetical protein